jgi:hypothetical protein
MTVVVDGYVRVSQVRGRKGPSFISPLEQRDETPRALRTLDEAVRLREEIPHEVGVVLMRVGGQRGTAPWPICGA